ncbi:MAG: rRNA maturation RNase YbeY [Bacteroidota bacterium]
MIHFHAENIKFTLKNKSILKQWITAVIRKNKCKKGGIAFVFCPDEYLLNINKEYLNHNTYTDIVTFDYTEGNMIKGDIFISVERVKENAVKFSKSFEDELHRVIIHGILHLLGYKDKTKAAKAEMTKQEDTCLRKLRKLL